MHLSKSRKVFPAGWRIVQAPVSPASKRAIVASALVALLLGSNARAQTQTDIQTPPQTQTQAQPQTQTQAQTQTGDWQAVENLKPGTRITVKARHNTLCVFQSATEDELVCKPIRFLRLGPNESRFDRQSVREVRLAHNQAKDMWIGAGIGAAGGAIAGASKSTDNRGFNAFVGGLSGALVGSVVGGIVSIPRRGKLIYRQ